MRAQSDSTQSQPEDDLLSEWSENLYKPTSVCRAGLGNFSGASVNAAQESDPAPHSQSENGPGVATVTEQQQQQFVQQMLQALANSNYRVS